MQEINQNHWLTSTATAVSQYLFKLGSYILKINKQFLVHDIINTKSQDLLL